MPQDTSEFRYLPAQAARLGVTAPAVHRVTLRLSDGRSLSALRYGDDAPRVTLLHGAGLNAHTWDTTVLHLGQPALSIDLAGHGDSSWREDIDYRPHTLAADIAEALQAWTTEPQVLVGQSLGGLTAAATAAAQPASVAHVVIVDITPGINQSGPSQLGEFYSRTDFASRDEVVDYAMSFGLGGDRADTERGVLFNTRVRDDGRVEWKHHFAHLAGRLLTSTSEGSASALTSPDQSWADLAAVAAPIDLVRGTRGYLSDDDLAEFTRRVPTASVHEFDATHNVQETAPAELASLISGLLATPAQ